MSDNLLLEIKKLSVGFSDGKTINTAVNEISFSLNKNETLAIVGESGSGKSVTALSVMQLLPVPPGKITAGEINYYSEKGIVDFVKLSEREMRPYRGKDVGMVFKEPMTSLNPVRRCGSQLMESIQVHRKMKKSEAKKTALKLFEKVKLPNPERVFRAYPFELSGGQKQRIMIAMAISCNPKILIADEPTTALDVTIQKNILMLLKELQTEYGMGMLFITHDLGVVSEIADKVAVMYKGKIVESGYTADIFSNPKHAYTKGLLACRPQLNSNKKRLPVISDFYETALDGRLIERNDENHMVSEESTKKTGIQSDISKPILEVSNLNTYFTMKKSLFGKVLKQHRAVNNISFKVYPGETLGLVGESGCGKTTLGRSILQLIRPASGEIFFCQKNIMKFGKGELRRMRKDIQIIFQDPFASLNPRITIGNAITEPMQVHKIKTGYSECKSYAIEILERVGLTEAQFNRYPHEFSGGQRQRICIARALAVEPRFIICDESVSALDVSIQAQVLNLLNDLKQDYGFTYIFISHDLSVVKHMSDRVMVMKDGELIEVGTSEEIYSNPKSTYTRQLIEAIPKVKSFA